MQKWIYYQQRNSVILVLIFSDGEQLSFLFSFRWWSLFFLCDGRSQHLEEVQEKMDSESEAEEFEEQAIQDKGGQA